MSLGYPGSNVWKIKSNGDSLTQITFNGGNAPHWNFDGTRLAYWRTEPGGVEVTYITDPNGAPLDTLYECGITLSSDWTHPQYIANVAMKGIVLCDFQTGQRFAVTEIVNKYDSTDFTFVNDHTLLWSTRDQLYLTNIYTDQTNRVLLSCDSRLYTDPTYSAQSNKLLMVKTLRSTNSARTTLYLDHRIVMMNPDGTEEVEIPLP